ncbi:PP2C family protein-serine/threonine phosphatase [Nocardiopsis valliformis]|uniref:PP2C family protein-serine/threonine phosphatase n=1 Tax=Nocardiopsis valliformis TaxID=239974 RepID=UPI0012692A8E|nr:protein phosphatase 2C domain-containing protein [Nocardiopsis valliformis]
MKDEGTQVSEPMDEAVREEERTERVLTPGEVWWGRQADGVGVGEAVAVPVDPPPSITHIGDPDPAREAGTSAEAEHGAVSEADLDADLDTVPEAEPVPGPRHSQSRGTEPGPSPTSSASGGADAFVPPLVLTEPVNKQFHARGLPRVEWAAPDSVLDEADYPGLSIRAASLRGDAHRYNMMSRQDSLALYELEHSRGRAVLACVADGIGSRTQSHRGSSYACRVVVGAVRERLEELLFAPDEDTARRLAEQVVHQVAQEMISVEGQTEALRGQTDTTLTLALADLTPEGEPTYFMLVSVGDSPAYLLRDREMEPLTGESVEDTSITSTATDALPRNIGHVQLNGCTVNPGEMLLLCSDGLSNPMAASSVAEQLVEWWGGDRVPGRLEFGWQLDFQAKTHDDDRTAICLWGR